MTTTLAASPNKIKKFSARQQHFYWYDQTTKKSEWEFEPGYWLQPSLRLENMMEWIHTTLILECSQHISVAAQEACFEWRCVDAQRFPPEYCKQPEEDMECETVPEVCGPPSSSPSPPSYPTVFFPLRLGVIGEAENSRYNNTSILPWGAFDGCHYYHTTKDPVTPFVGRKQTVTRVAGPQWFDVCPKFTLMELCYLPLWLNKLTTDELTAMWKYLHYAVPKHGCVAAVVLDASVVKVLTKGDGIHSGDSWFLSGATGHDSYIFGTRGYGRPQQRQIVFAHDTKVLAQISCLYGFSMKHQVSAKEWIYQNKNTYERAWKTMVDQLPSHLTENTSYTNDWASLDLYRVIWWQKI
jgi:hypothetical protein